MTVNAKNIKDSTFISGDMIMNAGQKRLASDYRA